MRPPDDPGQWRVQRMVRDLLGRVEQDELRLPAQVRRRLFELGLAMTAQDDPPDTPGQRIAAPLEPEVGMDRPTKLVHNQLVGPDLSRVPVIHHSVVLANGNMKGDD
jgi:hypothetical protein